MKTACTNEKCTKVVDIDAGGCPLCCTGVNEAESWFPEARKDCPETGLLWKFIWDTDWYWDVEYVFGYKWLKE